MAARDDTAKRKILEEARKRFRRAYDWEATARTRFLDDLKFAEGDAYNNYQWPNGIQGDRAKRPMLTVNRVRQHNLDILNDARQSRVAVKVRPLRGGASYESAMMLDGLIRHIEYISNAESAYQLALKFAVQAGIGYIRITTDYAGDDTFDQEIYIRQIKNPLTVLLDPDINEFDGSDAKFGFIFTDMPREEFDRKYPKFKDVASDETLGPDVSWGAGEMVRIAEYFRCVEEESKLLSFIDPQTGERVTKSIADMDEDLAKAVIDTPGYEERLLPMVKVEHFKIIGDHLAEENEWPGRYIPLLRCVGEETVIDGVMDRKGHTRALLDSQRMFNYNCPLDLETPIPTPDGWVKMGDIKAGDTLLDEHGKPAKVLGLSPTFLFRDCYDVTFDDGSVIRADAEHKWTVEQRGKRVAAGQSWSMTDVRTDELTPGKHFIYAAKPLELPEASLPVDPYVLGYWLGNGRADGSRFTAGTEDTEEIAGHIAACGYGVSAPRHYANKAGAADVTVYGLVTALKTLGVVGNKHIPAPYLRASREQRLALLQGLMDSDGSISKQGQCSFQNSNMALADGFAELLRTLGLKATCAATPMTVRRFPGGNVSLCQEGRRFAFSADPQLPVFRLSRKAAVQQRERPLHPRRTKRHRIVSVVRAPSVPVRCLSVDTPTHLFLAGPGMVPTHNSAAVEYGALQTKSPWVAPAKATEGYEEEWASANTQNFSVLSWNHIDEDGNPVPPPQRPQPPSAAPVFMQGMRDAIEQMYLASGQNQADFGQPGNEKSGVAIAQRQRQGDNATYHYLDHQAAMIRLCGKQLLDLIPKVYDTERMVKYRDDAGNETEIQINPEAPEALQMQENQNGPNQAVLNPKVGTYDVQADVGPAYATRRQEAFNAFSQLLAANKELVNVVGDIWMRFADIPGAEEAAQRLKRLVPQQALQDGPAPDVLKLQEQIKGMTELIGNLSTKLESKEGEAINAAEKNAIAAYKVTTDRVKALEKALALDPGGLMVLVKEVIEEAQAQSASGNALEHALDDDPALEQIHPGMGGQLQGPAPHAPPVDPNKPPPMPA